MVYDDHTERMVVSVLLTLEIKFNTIENVVACVRAEYDEAQHLKQHFLNSDIGLYFPKILAEPVQEVFRGPGGIPVLTTIGRRTYPWIVDYWNRKARRGEIKSPDLVFLDEKTKATLNEAIREKK